MDWRINYVDISSCLLFETTGDSEADSTANHADDTDGSSLEGTGLAEDDAFSCSCESDKSNDFDHLVGDYNYVDHDDQNEVEEEKSVDVGPEYYDEGRDEDEEEEDVVDQVLNDANYRVGDTKVFSKRYPDGVLMGEAGPRMKKVKVCGSEFLNEQDNDTHFWEACLAS